MRIRVLVVEDSVTVRKRLCEVLASDPELEVVGVAANGRIALGKLPQLAPDVMVLDVEMPEMDGLATLAALRKMNLRLPVIMFSTLTERGASATLEALSLGASDYVTKPANVGSVSVASTSATMRRTTTASSTTMTRTLGAPVTTPPDPAGRASR